MDLYYVIMAFAIAISLFLLTFSTHISLQFNAQVSWTKLFQKDTKTQDTELEIILNEFDIENPYIVKQQQPGLNDGKMLKTLFKNGKFAKMVYNIEEIPITKNVLQNDVVIFVTKMMEYQFRTLQLLIEALIQFLLENVKKSV